MCSSWKIYFLNELNPFHMIDRFIYSFSNWNLKDMRAVVMQDFDDIFTNLIKFKILIDWPWMDSICFAWGTLHGRLHVPWIQYLYFIMSKSSAGGGAAIEVWRIKMNTCYINILWAAYNEGGVSGTQTSASLQTERKKFMSNKGNLLYNYHNKINIVYAMDGLRPSYGWLIWGECS